MVQQVWLAEITHGQAKLMVIEYELWKEKMRQHQTAQKGSQDD